MLTHSKLARGDLSSLGLQREYALAPCGAPCRVRTGIQGQQCPAADRCLHPTCRMFCQATGFGGTVQEGQTVEDKLRAREENPDEAVERAAAAREVTVSFNADVADAMPWRFVPAQRSVKVSPAFDAIPVH